MHAFRRRYFRARPSSPKCGSTAAWSRSAPKSRSATLSSSTTANVHLLPDDPVSAAQRLIKEGRPAEAAALLESGIAANRGGLLLRLMLQKALTANGDREAALAAARE